MKLCFSSKAFLSFQGKRFLLCPLFRKLRLNRKVSKMFSVQDQAELSMCNERRVQITNIKRRLTSQHPKLKPFGRSSTFGCPLNISNIPPQTKPI